MNSKLLLLSPFIFIFSCQSNNSENKKTSEIKEEQINVKESCGYSGVPSADKVYSFISDHTTEKYIDEIMQVEGLPQNFKVKAVDIPDNAFAIIARENDVQVRYIMYSQEFFENIKKKTNSNYAIKSILAHEIAHHLCGHTLSNDGSRPLTELEADRFSGFALRKLGASLEESLCAIKSFGTLDASSTHPASASRIAAITNGWKAADELNSESTVQHQTTSNSTSAEVNSSRYVICNMGNFVLALRNKIMSKEELSIANSNNQEAKSILDANTLVGIMSNNQEFYILETIGNYLKVQTTLAGQNAVGYIPSKVFGKKIFCAH